MAKYRAPFVPGKLVMHPKECRQEKAGEKRREVRIFSFGHCLVPSISNLVSKGKKS